MGWFIFVELAVIQTVLFYWTRHSILGKQTITFLRLAYYLYRFTAELKKIKKERSSVWWKLQNWTFSGHLEDYANKTQLATLRKVAG